MHSKYGYCKLSHGADNEKDVSTTLVYELLLNYQVYNHQQVIFEYAFNDDLE